MKPTRSLRWRIQLWHGAFLAAVLAGLGFAAWHYERQKGMQRIDGDLGRRLTVLFDSVPPREGGRPGGPPPRRDVDGDGDLDRPPRRGPPPHRRGGRPPELRFSDAGRALFKDAYYFTTFNPEGRVLDRSDNSPTTVQPPSRGDATAEASGTRTVANRRERFMFMPQGECLLVGCPLDAEQASLRHYALMLVGIESGILLLGLAGGWWMTSRALRPLAAIRTTATDISAGRLDQRIGLPQDGSELGELAALLDDTFGKLESSFARQARFTSDAAHELRTPLSVVISQAQMALRGEREPAEYREMFEASLRGAKRMQALTQALLELARLDNGAVTTARTPCDLAELAEEAVSLVAGNAAERGVTLIRQLSPAPCPTDSEAVLRVIVNLLNNAIEHGGTPVTVATAATADAAILTVTDRGPGIPEKHLPHLFERFYRADESRNRKTGGTGLGLAICKAITDAHGGSLTVASTIGEGTVFTVTLPVE
ncbi:ATP-binding protein [Luteolibacter sp. SL250]|uniref:sensor histidine kinase n=1 Tax=Luteolibacter sp. SL250 TaxID=2995170 RepID=UPI002271F423|nr:ATP-binding protein [Luteolibacter sp. SL250]WAC18973.1 ATP-binding protein [Luteolibacter sp. SL250]